MSSRLSTSIYNTSEWKTSLGSVYHTKTAATAALKGIREATSRAPEVTEEHFVRYARGDPEVLDRYVYRGGGIHFLTTYLERVNLGDECIRDSAGVDTAKEMA
jgi:hypothetical protein